MKKLTLEQHMKALAEAHPMDSTGVEIDRDEEVPEDACCGAINRKTGSRCFRKLLHLDTDAYPHEKHVSYDHDLYEAWDLGQRDQPPSELLPHATSFEFEWDGHPYVIKRHTEDRWQCWTILPQPGLDHRGGFGRIVYLSPDGGWGRTFESYFDTAGEALAVLRRHPYKKEAS